MGTKIKKQRKAKQAATKKSLVYEDMAYEMAAKHIETHYDGSDVHDPLVNSAITRAARNIRKLKRVLLADLNSSA